MDTEKLQFLNQIEVLKNVPKEQLKWLEDHCTPMEEKKGFQLFKENEEMRATYFIIEGDFQMLSPQKDGFKEVVSFGENDIVGYLPFSRGKHFHGVGLVKEDLKCLFFPIF